MNKWEYKTIKVKTGGFMGGKVDETEFEREFKSIWAIRMGSGVLFRYKLWSRDI